MPLPPQAGARRKAPLPLLADAADRAKTLAKEDVNRDKDTTPDLLPSGRRESQTLIHQSPEPEQIRSMAVE
ncbi:hypothetical protein Y1Q_0006799 [Alligator mississippiensis]|uniref:Uncharacterized protein n=1 Tax=Alligator mississippiensis TaxID=8496 RepID=A0A151M5S0_ALLMI|nr:hypothetical protein Y1Q_0006799 [Alligator mississippiensis]